MDPFLISYFVLWLVVLTEGVVIVVLARTIGSLMLSRREAVDRDGLQPGVKAPDFIGEGVGGGQFLLSQMRGRWVVLLMAAPACSICHRLLPALAPVARELGTDVAMFVLLRSDAQVARAHADTWGQHFPLVAIGEHGVADSYRVRVSPFAHVIDPQGYVRAKGLVNTAENVEHLLYEAGFRHPRLESHAPEFAGAGDRA